MIVVKTPMLLFVKNGTDFDSSSWGNFPNEAKCCNFQGCLLIIKQLWMHCKIYTYFFIYSNKGNVSYK